MQQHTKLCTYRTLTALDITNRIMRKDNYLIALINGDVIDVRLFPPAVSLQYEPIQPPASPPSEEAVSSSWVWSTLLESIIRLCVLDPIPAADFTLSPAYTGADAARQLRWRFIRYGLLTLLFLPFLFLFLSILFILRHAEELHNKRSLSSSRQWGLFSQWKLREFNELSHFFHHRLALASQAASVYITQFPSPFTSILCAGVAYCAGAVVGVLLLMTLSGSAMNAHVLDRSLLWWLAIFSGILAVSRSFVHSPSTSSASATPTPATAFSRLTSFTHYHPRQWRGAEHTMQVHNAVVAMYQTPVSAFLKEMTALLVCPLVLLFILPGQSERVVDYVRKHSVEVSGVGVVCDSARFELGEEVDVRERGGGKTKRRRRGGLTVAGGKDAKSFLSFSINHQHWKVAGVDEDPTHSPRRHARERLLLSIAEDVHADSSYQRQPRRERGGGRGRRDRSVDSLGSESSDESLSASPSRSVSPSSGRGGGQGGLTASDRHLLVSFADLLGESTRGSRMMGSSIGGGSMMGSMRGSRGQLKGKAGRMQVEMRESVGEVMRSKMFAVLEKRVEEEEEGQDEEVEMRERQREVSRDDGGGISRLGSESGVVSRSQVRTGSLRRTRLEVSVPVRRSSDG